MKRKLNKRGMLEAFLLAVVFFVQAILSFFPAKTAQAAVNAIEGWDENEIMDYGYRFSVKYQPGVTEVMTFGCDNQDKEAFTNHGRSERNADTVRMTGNYVPESAGVRYNNVGRDGQGNIVDFVVYLVGAENPEARYDMQTPVHKHDVALGTRENADGAFDWENNIAQPLVGFSLEGIGVYIYCVDSARVRFQFLKHGTNEPLIISGHGTVRDLDAQQGIYIPKESGLDRVYVINGNEHLSVDGMSVTAANVSLNSSDKRGWLNFLFNTDSICFDFVHEAQLEHWDQLRETRIAQHGSPEKWAEAYKKLYVDGDGNCLCPTFDGGKIMRGHAYFDFTSYCFGGVEIKKAPEKRVGASGCSWEEASAADRENPFMVREYEEFQYMVRTELTPNQLSLFQVEDTLEDCLIIDDTSKISVSDDIGQDVTEKFDLAIEGQKIICRARDEFVVKEAFTNNQLYTFAFKVHRKRDVDLSNYMASDGYSIVVPNSAAMTYQRINGTGESLISDTVWVRSIIPPELEISKNVSRYEWMVGETVDYTVSLTQTKENTRAVQVEMEDEIPQGLQLIEGEYSVETSPGAGECVISENGPDGWKAKCPSLGFGEVVTVHFRCRVTEEANGQEMSNIVIATAENFIDIETGKHKSVKDIAEIWVNSPQLEIDKLADKYEWRVGDEVAYRIVVNNRVSGTVAKDVQISDIGLPEGLVLTAGAGSVEILDALQQVDYPVPDKKTGQVYEIRPVDSYVEADENGFVFGCSYLPYSYPVTIVLHCTALENSNARENINIASVRAGNAPEQADDSEVYINTGDLWIEKTADHYEWHLGEQIEYHVVVENRREGTIARNVTVWDASMPVGLALSSPDSVVLNGIPESITEPVAGTPDVPNQLNPELSQETGQKTVAYEFLPEGNGWRLNLSDLPFGVSVDLTFFCTVTEEVNGMESINAAMVQAENAPEQTDDAEIYVNTAVLSIEKSFQNPYLAVGDGREANEFRVGEQVNYQVTATNLQKGSIAREVVISDLSLPEGLALDGDGDALAVYGIPEIILNPVSGTDDAGNVLNPENYNQVEQKPVVYQVTRHENGWILTISDLPYHVPVTVNFRCTVQENMNGLEVVNTASAYADNAAPVEAGTKIWINSPVLKVEKTADKPSYKYGDIVTYQVKMTQEQIGCIARNVELADVIETPGMRLLKDSIVLLDENGNMVDCVVEANEDNTFLVHTGRCLVNDGKYGIYDSGQGGWTEQVLANPLDIREQGQMTVEYCAAVIDENLAGQTVHNTATVNSQENIPSSDEETVEIHCPILDIVKESDKKEYQEGEKGYYKLTVRQLREDVTADNIVIEDTMNIQDMIVKADNILIKKNGEKLETAVIETGEDIIRITTGTSLGDKDKLEVYYEVFFENVPEAGGIAYNLARAWGDGVPEVSSEREVYVKPHEPVPTATPAPTPTPTPAPTSTPVPTSTPTPTPAPTATPTPRPTPTTAACPKLTPVPTRIPTPYYGNNGNNGSNGSGFYQGSTNGNYSNGFSGGYQTSGAKTGDTRPFALAGRVGIFAIVLMAAGAFLYRKGKKPEEKQ